LIGRLLVANRGEIALRIMRTCRELGVPTVAVYSDADRQSPHVRYADQAVYLGPAPSRESYLSMDRILEAARRSGARAIHPGYGFLSENAEFARRVSSAGLVFVGPDAESIRAMGDKTEARKLVSRAGVPTVPGTEGPVASVDEARTFCETAGFPVLLKAAAGGGGKGMRIVRRVEDLPSALRGARSEAESAFGDSRIYLEKYLERPRHVEFQILGDRFGSIVHLGERECSIQRRHQKVIEESPSVIVDEALRKRMGETAVKAAAACRYQNAGTVEFLLDAGKNFYFLEMNTRLQVEHPITELRTGIDLVAAQLRIASGERLPFTQEEVRFRGHAIECRICAEDVENDFLPSTGSILHLHPAEGPGVRDDRGVEEGGEISVYYDSLIAKLVVWGASREEAIRKMKRALREYQILGVKTNIPVCRFVMEHERFSSGDFDTHFLQDHFQLFSFAPGTRNQRVAAAVVCAALEDQRPRLAISADGSAGSNHAAPGGWKRQRINLMRS
jgi:acetyl-CoA carboxylase biotin carboxylase subunit